MGDDPYTQSSDRRLFHSLSSRNPVIRRPDGVINGTRRGYKRPTRRGNTRARRGNKRQNARRGIAASVSDGVSQARNTRRGYKRPTRRGYTRPTHRYPTGYRVQQSNGGEGIAFRLHATPSKGYKGSCTTGSTSYTNQVSLRRRAMRGKNAGFTCETKLLVGGVGVEP